MVDIFKYGNTEDDMKVDVMDETKKVLFPIIKHIVSIFCETSNQCSKKSIIHTFQTLVIEDNLSTIWREILSYMNVYCKDFQSCFHKENTRILEMTCREIIKGIGSSRFKASSKNNANDFRLLIHLIWKLDYDNNYNKVITRASTHTFQEDDYLEMQPRPLSISREEFEQGLMKRRFFHDAKQYLDEEEIDDLRSGRQKLTDDTLTKAYHCLHQIQSSCPMETMLDPYDDRQLSCYYFMLFTLPKMLGYNKSQIDILSLLYLYPDYAPTSTSWFDKVTKESLQRQKLQILEDDHTEIDKATIGSRIQVLNVFLKHSDFRIIRSGFFRGLFLLFQWGENMSFFREFFRMKQYERLVSMLFETYFHLWQTYIRFYKSCFERSRQSGIGYVEEEEEEEKESLACIPLDVARRVVTALRIIPSYVYMSKDELLGGEIRGFSFFDISRINTELFSIIEQYWSMEEQGTNTEEQDQSWIYTVKWKSFKRWRNVLCLLQDIFRQIYARSDFITSSGQQVRKRISGKKELIYLVSNLLILLKAKEFWTTTDNERVLDLRAKLLDSLLKSIYPWRRFIEQITDADDQSPLGECKWSTKWEHLFSKEEFHGKVRNPENRIHVLLWLLHGELRIDTAIIPYHAYEVEDWNVDQTNNKKSSQKHDRKAEKRKEMEPTGMMDIQKSMKARKSMELYLDVLQLHHKELKDSIPLHVNPYYYWVQGVSFICKMLEPRQYYEFIPIKKCYFISLRVGLLNLRGYFLDSYAIWHDYFYEILDSSGEESHKFYEYWIFFQKILTMCQSINSRIDAESIRVITDLIDIWIHSEPPAPPSWSLQMITKRNMLHERLVPPEDIP